jgi:hypothetical protein
MPRFKTYECPSCAGAFEEFHMTADEPPPRFCRLCGFDTHAEAFTQPLAAPRIQTALAKGVDATYRAAEEGAEFRAQMAQEMGLDKEAADTLKITDMRSNTKPGETAVVPVNNTISRIMDQYPEQTGFNAGAANYQGLSAGTRSGAFPNAGAIAQKQLRGLHQRYAQGSGHKGAVVSDVPANEIIENPNYQPRVRSI